MNREYIDDHHIVARYLAHRLSDAERSAFEAYFLKHPEMVEELEEAAQLKAGLMRLRDTGELESLLKPKPWYRQRRLYDLRGRFGGTLAAAAILGVSAFLWLNRHPVPSGQWLAPTPASLMGPLGRPLPAGGTYTILRTRGESTDLDIELPASAQTLALRVLPETMAQPAVYRVTLYAVDGTELHEVATVAGLTPAEDEFVPVFLDSSQVKKGRYRLALEGVGSPASHSVFALRFY
jgi:hypothetical protein